jgi:membrane dipeptidase
MGMENGAPLEGNIKNLEYFYKRGIRYITLCHNKDNHICDSATDTASTWNGLSPFGEQVVREMNKLGMMVDASHISDSSFYDVITVSVAPVIVSHGACRHFVPERPRNLSDDQIKSIGNNRGIVMISFGSAFLNPEAHQQYLKNKAHLSAYFKTNKINPESPAGLKYEKEYNQKFPGRSTLQQAADHIDRVVSLAGIDYVGFGSDFDGVSGQLPDGLRDVSEYPNLIAELKRRGYQDADIEKICSKNIFRVWNEVAEIARSLRKLN